MGISLSAIEIWARTIDSKSINGSTRIITLGKQAIYCTYDAAVRVLRRNRYAFVDLPASDQTLVAAETLSERHRGKMFIDDLTLFRMLGFARENVYRMDVNDFEGADIIFDLNKEWTGPTFDFVFDQGTGEHIFSQYAYFANCSRLLNVGGMYVAHLPSSDIGHGFYCYGKDALRDFFIANGFEEKYLRYVYIPAHDGGMWDYFVEMPVDSAIQSPAFMIGVSAVFRKLEQRNVMLPNQTAYVKMWESHAKGQQTWKPQRSSMRQAARAYVLRKFPTLSAAIIGAKNTRKILTHGQKVEL